MVKSQAFVQTLQTWPWASISKNCTSKLSPGLLNCSNIKFLHDGKPDFCFYRLLYKALCVSFTQYVRFGAQSIILQHTRFSNEFRIESKASTMKSYSTSPLMLLFGVMIVGSHTNQPFLLMALRTAFR